MLEICSCMKNELPFIINKTWINTYFPVKKPAEYQAFKTAARSVPEPLISSSSELFLSFPELHVAKTIMLCHINSKKSR